MLEARREIYRDALSGMLEPVTLWTLTDLSARSDVRELAEEIADLSPLLTARHERTQTASLELGLGVLSPSGPQRAAPLGARFLGAPEGFLADLLVDEILALSRGRELASPLAREALRRVQAPVRARVLGTPG